MQVKLHIDPTLAAMNAAIEGQQETKPRSYLGLSSWGDDCGRKLWYRFRWVAPERFPADVLRKFADGHRTEDIRAADLRLVDGIELHTHTESGGQFGVVALGGHVRGHMDGAILGLLQAPKSWHVWEHKTCDEKQVKALEKAIAEHGEKNALQHWNATYFAQAQGYMGLTGMKRHYMTVDSSGGRRTVSCRTEFQAQAFNGLMDRARQIVESPVPLEKLSSTPTFYKCKWCNFSDLCHGSKKPAVSCRTCAHSTPEIGDDDSGTWTCSMQGKCLSREDQERACDHHIYIPGLLPNAQHIDATATAVQYQLPDGSTFWNGPDNTPDQFASSEIKAAASYDQLLDPLTSSLRETVDARLVEGLPG